MTDHTSLPEAASFAVLPFTAPGANGIAAGVANSRHIVCAAILALSNS
jgi:hypothetical protein